MKEIVIKVKAFESALVDSAVVNIIDLAKKENSEISGPIPLPTKREIFTILKSPHVNKKSREQFEIRTNKRLIIIKKSNQELVDKLQKLNLPSGVEIEVKEI